jgi:ribosomal protein S18 acetylase RimI-like enzyme
MEPIVPSVELSRRIRNADCAYTASRVRLLEALPGNPMGAEVRRIGKAWAFRVAGLPMASFTRVVGLEGAQADQVQPLADWFRDNGSLGRFEIAPDEAIDQLGPALTLAGYAHFAFHATLYGPPDGEARPLPPSVEIEAVEGAEALEDFLDVYAAGWNVPEGARDGFKANVRGWLGLPGWTLYLAHCDGRPAGEAILFMHEGVGYLADGAVRPEFRGRGLHRAMIDRRRDDARAAGADVLCVQAAYLSTSHRNMVRAGLALLYAQAFWTPRP